MIVSLTNQLLIFSWCIRWPIVSLYSWTDISACSLWKAFTRSWAFCTFPENKCVLRYAFMDKTLSDDLYFPKEQLFSLQKNRKWIAMSFCGLWPPTVTPNWLFFKSVKAARVGSWSKSSKKLSAQFRVVTVLCYARPARPNGKPYNLNCI